MFKKTLPELAPNANRRCFVSPCHYIILYHSQFTYLTIISLSCAVQCVYVCACDVVRYFPSWRNNSEFRFHLFINVPGWFNVTWMCMRLSVFCVRLVCIKWSVFHATTNATSSTSLLDKNSIHLEHCRRFMHSNGMGWNVTFTHVNATTSSDIDGLKPSRLYGNINHGYNACYCYCYNLLLLLITYYGLLSNRLVFSSKSS
jgi:hypothetical protein